MAKKRTIKRKYRKLLGFVYLGISAIFIYTLCINAFRVIDQQKELTRLEERKTELEKEKKALSQEVELLNDDDYVARYARDNYVFSKDGEEVVRLPESKK